MVFTSHSKFQNILNSTHPNHGVFRIEGKTNSYFKKGGIKV